MFSLDKISIITVVYNRKDDLEKTLNSILSQSYSNIELIIVDGGSTDGTLEVIKNYHQQISRWVSEPDKNIYHAMNKGISMCSGKWLNFMNAGDIFYDKDVVKNVFDKDYGSEDILLGKSIIAYENFSREYRNGNKAEIWKGARFIHQSCFIKAAFQKNNLYNDQNEISADFEFFFRAIELHKIETADLDLFVSIFQAGGLSDNRRVQGLIENYKIVRKKYRYSIKVFSFYFAMIMREIFTFVIKSLLTKHHVSAIQKYIYGIK